MWELCYRFLVLFLVFVIQKVTINQNVRFTDYASGISLPDNSRLAINWKNDNDITIFWHDVIIKIFWRSFFSFVKFHVNTMAGSGVVTIFYYKRLIRNLEIGNTPIWVLPNIWRLGQVRDSKFGTNFSNKMLLNNAKVQGCSFYPFWVIKGKPTGRGTKLTPTQIRVKIPHKNKSFNIFWVALKNILK